MGKKKEIKPTRHLIQVAFSPEDMERLRAAAERDHRTVKNYVELVIIQHLQRP